MGSLTDPALQKAWEKISTVCFISDLGSCWVWTGKTNRNGYGVVRVGKLMFMVHRVLYQQTLRVTLDEGLVLDHKCRNRLCCNPWHLEPVSVRENTLRGEGPTAQNARKTHCPRNHEYTPENTYIRPCGRRRCKACGKKTV